jgi:serine/threonine protein phosphatase PrpC
MEERDTTGSRIVRLVTSSSPTRKGFYADAVTHPGITRAHKPNEDSYSQAIIARQLSPDLSQSIGLFLVADGMGGHDHGKYASSFIIDEIQFVMGLDITNPYISAEDLKDRFIKVIKQANTKLVQDNNQIDAFRGTTLTGVLLIEQPDPVASIDPTYIAYVVNVGDSRTYRYSPASGLTRITRDHSTVEELIASGVITPEERYTDRRRNQIHRCLGDKPDVDVDVFTVRLGKSDRLLLCSDGLWEMVRDPEIAHFVSLPTGEPSLITSGLIQAALNGGGHDNVTALMIMLPD